jgi:hypothetical protein
MFGCINFDFKTITHTTVVNDDGAKSEVNIDGGGDNVVNSNIIESSSNCDITPIEISITPRSVTE